MLKPPGRPDSLRALVPLDERPEASVVEVLEDLLSRARDGQIRALAYAAVRREGPGDVRSESGWATGTTSHRVHLVGGLEVTKAWVVGAVLDDQEDIT